MWCECSWWYLLSVNMALDEDAKKLEIFFFFSSLFSSLANCNQLFMLHFLFVCIDLTTIENYSDVTPFV